MYITGYLAVCEPVTGHIPVQECIESLYDHLDSIVVLDCSKYDNLDLSKYGKVKKHVKSIWNCFDNPIGSAFTAALRLVDSDTAMFIDADELFDFKGTNLRKIIERYPMQPGVGVAFSLRNYYCSRSFVLDGCSSKGAHVFRMSDNLFHDMLNGYWKHHTKIRRTNNECDNNDGARIVSEQCLPIAHYPPVDINEVVIHHVSHLFPAAKLARSLIQFGHTSTIDLLDFFPIDLRQPPDVIDKMNQKFNEDIENGDVDLYGYPEKIEYEGNLLLDKYVSNSIARGMKEFDPTKQKDYKRWADAHKNKAAECINFDCTNQ